MLQWTAARYTWDEKPPTSSLGHVLYAYHHGVEVKAWYEQQARLGRALTIKQRASAAQIGRTLQSFVVMVPLADDLTEHLGWKVVRVIIPGAFPRESNSELMHLDGPRLSSAMSTWGLGDAVHTAPNPFG